jgi:hypothetical protein
MDRGKRILERNRSNFQVGGGFRGFNFQAGYGYKGEHFQEGYGVGGMRATMAPGRYFRRRQRGQGWGWLSKFAARALPFLSKGVKEVGRSALTTVTDQAVNSSMRFLDDVLEGENVLDSARSRLKEGGDALRYAAKSKAKEGAMDLVRAAKRKLSERGAGAVQGGSGRKRRKTCTAKRRRGRKRKPAKRGRKRRVQKGGKMWPRRRGRTVSQSRAFVRGGRKRTFGVRGANLPYRHIFDS